MNKHNNLLRFESRDCAVVLIISTTVTPSALGLFNITPSCVSTSLTWVEGARRMFFGKPHFITTRPFWTRSAFDAV